MAGIIHTEGAALGRTARNEPGRMEEALRAMHDIRASQCSFDARVVEIIDLGRNLFDLPVGLLGHVAGRRLEVVQARAPSDVVKPGDALLLDRTYDQQTLQTEGPVVFERATSPGPGLRAGYGSLDLQAYLGMAVRVAGDPWGTLSFAGPTPREVAFSAIDRGILQLMAQHIGAGLAQELLEKELRISRERYRYFVEHTAEGFYRLESERPIDTRATEDEQIDLMYRHMFVAECNNFYAAMYGFSRPESMIGARLIDLHRGPDEPENRAALRAFVRSAYRVIDVETQECSKAGDVIHLLNNAVGIVDQGRLFGIWGTQRDVTERKMAEEERQRLETQMQRTQRLESVGVLAGGIAHDFNNLLTGIVGNAGLAQLALPDESPVQSHIELIQRSAERAADLCKQLLAYSGKGRLVVRPIDLSALVRDIVSILKISVSKKIELECELEDDLPAVELDAGQVQQVIMNLITNASDAIGDRCGTIRIATGVRDCDRAYFRGSSVGAEASDGRYVYAEVSDDGCGMNEPTRERIFDPFFTTKSIGRGLGLAAVLGIVRGHGGAISIDTRPGRGTRFTVLFPASELPPEELVARAPAATQWRGAGLVLVVDDEEAIRTLAGECLSRCGFDVLTAADGQEGLRIFREHSADVVALLIDMTMPRLSGDELFRELRRIRPDTPIVLSSGYDQSEIVARLACEDRTVFLNKPYRPAELVARIRDVLERPN